MKVLIAVLSSRQRPWGDMIETSKATWDSFDVPGVETVFYVGNPESPLEDKVIGVPVAESLYSMGHKNIAAWRWMLDNSDFDFMARVNASCYVHKARLLARCAGYPATGLLSGSTVEDTTRPPWMWGGHQFVMSRDVVQILVDNPHVWNHTEMEDVALSYAARSLEIPFTQGEDSCSIDHLGEGRWRVTSSPGKTFEFTNWADLAKADTEIFFRVKQDRKRHEDAYVMQELQTHLKP